MTQRVTNENKETGGQIKIEPFFRPDTYYYTLYDANNKPYTVISINSTKSYVPGYNQNGKVEDAVAYEYGGTDSVDEFNIKSRDRDKFIIDNDRSVRSWYDYMPFDLNDKKSLSYSSFNLKLSSIIDAVDYNSVVQFSTGTDWSKFTSYNQFFKLLTDDATYNFHGVPGLKNIMLLYFNSDLPGRSPVYSNYQSNLNPGKAWVDYWKNQNWNEINKKTVGLDCSGYLTRIHRYTNAPYKVETSPGNYVSIGTEDNGALYRVMNYADTQNLDTDEPNPNLKYLKPGDIIRFPGHVAMIAEIIDKNNDLVISLNEIFLIEATEWGLFKVQKGRTLQWYKDKDPAIWNIFRLKID